MSYSVALYLLDISRGMDEIIHDEQTGRDVSKLELGKEYIMRKLAPKINSSRLTEHAGIITFGGATDNPFFASDPSSRPQAEALEPSDFLGVSCLIYPQTAGAGMINVVRGIESGSRGANALAALLVAEEVMVRHAGTKQHGKSVKDDRWKREIILITHDKATPYQQGWEYVHDEAFENGLILRIIGVGFDPRSKPDFETEAEWKKACSKTQRFWEQFTNNLANAYGPDQDLFLPALGDHSTALNIARGPAVAQTQSTASKSVFRIGSKEIDAEEGIEFFVRTSKATAIARPMSMKKIITSELAKAGNGIANEERARRDMIFTNQSSQYASQGGKGAGTSQQQSQGPVAGSQSQGQQRISVPKMGNIGLEGDVTHFTKYVALVPKKEEPSHGSPDPAHKAKGGDDDVDMNAGGSFQARSKEGKTIEDQEVKDIEYEEKEMEKDNLVKAFKFGNTWVPMEENAFPPMETTGGIDVLGFIPSAGLKRYQEMGEVQFIWADPDNFSSQIQVSALVQAMTSKDFVAITRWVGKDNSAPKLGVCRAAVEEDLHYLYWVQIPFAEDERGFFFPSLHDLYTKSGKPITEHALLPTDEQVALMGDLVDEMDLDMFAEEDEGQIYPWFDPYSNPNPAIHRLNEAIFHLATDPDPHSNPVPPPHPDIIRFLYPPEEVLDTSAETVKRLKEALNVKKVPPPTKKPARLAKGVPEADDEEIDIDAIFDKSGPSGTQGAGKAAGPAPKKGRIISNEDPVGDFVREVGNGGVTVTKAMKDLADVSKEIVAGSFSSSAFGKALDCWQIMREQALMLEESDLYNQLYAELRTYIKDPSFKHNDFWNHMKRAQPSLQPISPQEAEDAIS